MEYTVQQRGRAAIDFLIDLSRQSDSLESRTDRFAVDAGLSPGQLPRDPVELQQRVTPVMQRSPDFRILYLCREWVLDMHGLIAMDAFEAMRTELEPRLKALQHGETELTYAAQLEPPAYWEGHEFHRSAGGWDGHDYMGFVHGELIHRRMIGETFAAQIFELRKSVARMSPNHSPEKIFEIGCGSGQYTMALATVFPASEIWACDLSPRQLEQAQRRANEAKLRWRLFQAAGENTGFEAGQFDLVTSYAVLHEMPAAGSKAVLAEAHRLLKPGGQLVIGDVKAYHAQDEFQIWKADYWNQVRGGDPYWREYASTDLARLATDAGFADASWAGVGDAKDPFVLTAVKNKN